jgi:hypothetical protein
MVAPTNHGAGVLPCPLDIPPKTLAVGFLTTLGVNVGDDFIREGIRNCFDRLGVAVHPYFVNKHDPSSVHEVRDIEIGGLRDKIRDCDVFVQSGAPVYWHHGEGAHRSNQADWHEWAWEQRILLPFPRPVFLNLGAGSCQPWDDVGDSFVEDQACASFAVRAADRAALTTVRDPVASHILSRLNVAHHCLPCPAFLAACKFYPAHNSGCLIGVNLMPKGGHFDLRGTFDSLSWICRLHELLNRLRQMGRVLFICHDAEEEQFAEYFVAGDERIFRAQSYREYLDLFRTLSCIFANRVHAAVTAAGFGVPGIIAGTDTRARIGEWIGLDVLQANTLDPSSVAQRMAELLRERKAEGERLVALRERTMLDYTNLLAPVLDGIQSNAGFRVSLNGEHPIQKWISKRQASGQWLDGLGVESFWPIQESGFHHREPYQNSALRWTDGNAALVFPAEYRPTVNCIELSLWNTHPDGHEFKVYIDGDLVLTGVLGNYDAWIGQCEFSPRPVGRIDIVSDAIAVEAESRSLGVALRNLRLHLTSAADSFAASVSGEPNRSG